MQSDVGEDLLRSKIAALIKHCHSIWDNLVNIIHNCAYKSGCKEPIFVLYYTEVGCAAEAQ